MLVANRRSLRIIPLAITLAAMGLPARAADFAGLVDIGDGREMYLECSGAGAPTVVLISGKGNGAADWHEILAPGDPVHDADYDAMAWGKGELRKSDSAVSTQMPCGDTSTPLTRPSPWIGVAM